VFYSGVIEWTETLCQHVIDKEGVKLLKELLEVKNGHGKTPLDFCSDGVLREECTRRWLQPEEGKEEKKEFSM
jgi:hypothetical protein